VSDELLKRQIVPEAEKALGVKLNIGTINSNDLQARTISAIQSGSGPDIICGLNNWPQLSAESVANVDKIVRRSVRRRKAASTRSRGSSPKTARSGSSWRSGPRPCDRASGARRPDQHVRRLNTNTEDPCKPARQPDPGWVQTSLGSQYF